VRPVFGEALGKDAQLLRFFAALTTKVLLVEGKRSTLHTSKFREPELTQDFLRVVKFLELDEGVVEVFKQWSKKLE